MVKRAKLTNKFCRNLSFSQDGQYQVRDEQVAGFMVVVGKKTRTYTIQLDMTVLGKRRTIKRKIGNVTDWDANAARQEAQRLIVDIRKDASKHVDRRKSLTLREAWKDYCKRMETRVKAGERSTRTVEGYRDYIERSLKDWLDVPLREIGERPEIVARRHEELTQEAGPYQANRVMTTLRLVYNGALKRRLDPGLPTHNPTSLVNFNPETRRNSGMGSDELKLWGVQLSQLQNPIRREFHLFTLLSAMRPDALKKARWEHLDVKKQILHVPEPKGGKRRAFDLPLSRPMLRCLWRVRKVGRVWHDRQSREWIFPSDAASGHIIEHKEPRNLLSHWGGDLRQTWRTLALVVGLSELDCSILMNHSLGGVNAGYISTPALREHLRDQQERVSCHIMGILELVRLSNRIR